jgi:hypothetical protein
MNATDKSDADPDSQPGTRPEDLGLSVLRSACNSEAKELAADWSDLGLEALLDKTVLEHAPMLGSVVKICAISKTIRDRLFLKKVFGFLRGCPKFNELEKFGFVREHLEDPEKTKKLSDGIVMVLDRLDDLEKADMIAKMFAALVRKQIDYSDFRRLASGIDRAYVGDLKKLLTYPKDKDIWDEKFLRLIEPAGFAETGGGQSRAGDIGTTTFLNRLGKLFLKCINED